MKQKNWLAVGLVSVGAAAAFYFSRRLVRQQRSKASAQKVIPDVAGNYDIDGVSFDETSREVVVSGDATHPVEDPKRSALLH